MDLLSLKEINDCFLNYKDLRSVKRFLSSRSLTFVKLGRNYFVKKSDFEEMIKGITEVIIFPEASPTPSFNEKEIKIYDRLKRKIDRQTSQDLTKVKSLL
jgi:hypothetical protein